MGCSSRQLAGRHEWPGRDAAAELDQRSRGVVAHSSGNHAQAIAFAAKKLGIRATLVVPETASSMKIEATRRWDAEVILVSPLGNARFDACARIIEERGAVLIEPYNAAAIMEANGTIGLEIIAQVPDVKSVIAPVAGGGLLAGLAASLVRSRPDIEVFGAEPELASDAHRSFRTGRIVRISPEDALRTVADGLRTTALGDLTWPLIRAYVKDIVTVSERAILDAVRRVASEARLVAEPSGAVGVAGAFAASLDPERTVVVISGGNVAPDTLTEILDGGK